MNDRQRLQRRFQATSCAGGARPTFGKSDFVQMTFSGASKKNIDFCKRIVVFILFGSCVLCVFCACVCVCPACACFLCVSVFVLRVRSNAAAKVSAQVCWLLRWRLDA